MRVLVVVSLTVGLLVAAVPLAAPRTAATVFPALALVAFGVAAAALGGGVVLLLLARRRRPRPHRRHGGRPPGLPPGSVPAQASRTGRDRPSGAGRGQPVQRPSTGGRSSGGPSQTQTQQSRSPSTVSTVARSRRYSGPS